MSDRLRLPIFAGLSLALHGAVFGAATWRRPSVSPPSPAFEGSSAALVGETLDVEPALAPAEEAEPSPESASTQNPSEANPVRALAHPAPGPGSASPAASGASGATPSAPTLFGAVGVRYATDLATTFTRAFPQAGSADSIWGSVPFGSAGTAEVRMVLDESGHLSSSAVLGSPSPALRRGIERTLALMGPRTFTARSATTRLRVAATVTRNEVHDGLHGDVFALSGGSFTGAVGTAFFALPAAGGGRRIDLELRLLP